MNSRIDRLQFWLVTIGFVGVIVAGVALMVWFVQDVNAIEADEYASRPVLGQVLEVPLGWRIVAVVDGRDSVVCVSEDGLQYRLCNPQLADR